MVYLAVTINMRVTPVQVVVVNEKSALPIKNSFGQISDMKGSIQQITFFTMETLK